MAELGEMSIALQERWQALRDAFREASDDLDSISAGLSLQSFGEFWSVDEVEFRRRAVELVGLQDSSGIAVVRRAYRTAKSAVDKHWADIQGLEADIEDVVRKTYKTPVDIHREIVERTPPPNIDWALRS